MPQFLGALEAHGYCVAAVVAGVPAAPLGVPPALLTFAYQTAASLLPHQAPAPTDKGNPLPPSLPAAAAAAATANHGARELRSHGELTFLCVVCRWSCRVVLLSGILLPPPSPFFSPFFPPPPLPHWPSSWHDASRGRVGGDSVDHGCQAALPPGRAAQPRPRMEGPPGHLGASFSSTCAAAAAASSWPLLCSSSFFFLYYWGGGLLF